MPTSVASGDSHIVKATTDELAEESIRDEEQRENEVREVS